jgi:phenylacetate-coenzyme A ligase PaaK-like adenylate-forming protein
MKVQSPPLAPAERTLAPLVSALEFWQRVGSIADLWWSRQGGRPSAEISGPRLQALLHFARSASPHYRRLYADLPRERPKLEQIPPMNKRELMANFEDCCTDPRIRWEDVERFLANRDQIGATFLGRYQVWKSSGTSGTPGIFLQDRRAMAVYDALLASQFDSGAMGTLEATRLAAGAGRSALVIATGDHFASITSWEHLRRAFPGVATRSFSVLDPLAKGVRELNAFKPAFLASYPSVLQLLAAERAAGRLKIAPALIWSGGEFLGDDAKQAIEDAFQCRVMNEYGASECLSIAYECRGGWMHVNSEWVILEGVDADGKPAAPGDLSHTVLLTNLANWVQPIIRYDIGDRMVTLGGPCACGNPRPAIRVEGRKDAILTLTTRDGLAVQLPPLAITTVVENAAGEHRFQIAQAAPDHLVVRFDADGGVRQRAARWRQAHGALRDYLCAQSLSNVRITLGRDPPQLDARSGKLHPVVVEAHEE